MTPVVVPAYAPPVAYFSWLLQQEKIRWVKDSHYKKQTYRNRAYIYGANGRLTLTVPILHSKNKSHQKENEVLTDPYADWQQLHWKSLQSAYRSSPFFEFYEEYLAPFYHQNNPSLYDFNLRLIREIFDILEIDIDQEEVPLDMSTQKLMENLLDAKGQIPALPNYTQVFENKYGFLSNLSILDLLFNLGPASRTYLKDCI